MHRLSEIRDRGAGERQRVDATYGGDNTVGYGLSYIERAIEPPKQKGIPVNEQLVSHSPPLLYKKQS